MLYGHDGNLHVDLVAPLLNTPTCVHAAASGWLAPESNLIMSAPRDGHIQLCQNCSNPLHQEHWDFA